MNRPSIYLTNSATVAAVVRGQASEASLACVGPPGLMWAGKPESMVYSIMRFPRADKGEAGFGRVLGLTPPSRLAKPAIAAKKDTDAGEAAAAQAWRDYEEALRAVWARHTRRLVPGRLSWAEESPRGRADARTWDGSMWVKGGQVPDGATLICACSRQAAADRRCHRVIAAELLAAAGWRVLLDGREVAPGV